MEDIKIQITNGNWKDAVRLIKNSNYEWIAVIQELLEDDIYRGDVITLLKVMEATGYIQEHKDYEL